MLPQEADFFKAKADRQAELLSRAVSGAWRQSGAACMEAYYICTDEVTVVLTGVKLWMPGRRTVLLPQEADFFKAKAERQAELLSKAELARMEAERDRARMESRFTHTDKGTAMLNAVRLKLELEACREKLARLESQVHACFSLAVSMPLLLCIHQPLCPTRPEDVLPSAAVKRCMQG